MVKATPPENPFFRYIWYRTHEYHKNWIQVITGQPGSGKSYCALKMAEILDPRFNMDKVTFTAKDFMEAIQKVKFKGEVIILDEVGIALSSRKWQSISNLVVNQVVQTFRFKNIITLLVVPDMTFIDSQARKVVNCFSVVKRNRDEASRMRIHTLSIDRRDGKTFFPHPKIDIHGESYTLDELVFKSMPSKEVINQYEVKHKEQKEILLKQNLRALELFDRTAPVSKDSIMDMVDTIRLNPIYYQNRQGTYDSNIIRLEFGVSEPKARMVKAKLDNEMIMERKKEKAENASIPIRLKGK